MSLEILDRLAAHASRDGGRIAVREVGPGSAASLTYAQLHDRVRQGAAELATQVNPGEVVLLITGNRVEFYIAALAAWSAGAALMPAHPSIADAELATVIQRTRARAVMTDPRCARSHEASIPRIDLDTFGMHSATPTRRPSETAALLLQSSGTTGLPKIAWRPFPAIDAVARNVADATRLTPNDRIFAAIPICHAYGIENGFLAAVWAGATVHLCDGLDVPTAAAELGGNATVFPGVPFMFEVLSKMNMESKVQGSPSLRLAYSAGAPLPAQVSQGFTQRFGLGVGQLYGASELGSVTFGDPDGPNFDAASAGIPMFGVRILILDQDDPDPSRPLAPGSEGQVAIHAPSMLARYVEADAPIMSGYFMTGDLGRLDERGRLFITGRLKHLIDIGGMKVNPAEVELTLKQHPAVADCVVVPIPVTQTVSRLKAIVTPSGAVPLDEADLRAFARERLAGFKVPRVIEVRQTLPRSPTGKILRRELEGVAQASRLCSNASNA
jgi:long-chain acyl-CoA synthetase